MPFQRGRPRPKPSFVRPPLWINAGTWSSFATQGTTAHRLATGPDIWLERFGPDLLVSYQTEPSRDAVLEQLDERCAVYSFKPQRVFGKYLPQQAAERGVPTLLRGKENVPLETEVTEAQIKYGLDFGGGYSAGLFIDQRENRARVRRSKSKRMLNTFAYTCSFSVVAALAGAETVSIDLSRKSLTRGEENFRRNGLDPKVGHRFLADDVLAVLPRLARRGEKFDTIILDPPTFSRNQAGAAFQVQRDFEKLLLLALEIASPRAQILLSVNHSEMRVADLERIARGTLRIGGRSGRFEQTIPLPDIPPTEGAKTIWLEVS